jgi:acyl carrier protein
LDNFENTLAAQVLEESMDVVEFIIHLEDELHIKVDANEVGPAAAEMTFGELAAEVCRHIR